jgi:GNAT superfamily N-acetyltransferase
MNDELRARALHAVALAPSPQLRYQRRGRHALQDGLALLACDVHDPTNNTVTALGAALDPGRALAAAEEFFANRPGGWGVTVQVGAEHPLELAVRERGWRIAEEEPLLALAPLARIAQAAGIDIRRVNSEALLTDFYAASREGFAAAESASPDSPAGEDLTRAFIPSLACALDPDLALFVGYVDGRAVAASGLCRIGQVAEIIGVSVVPAFRRRGFGAAITWAAIGEGAVRGCTAAALRATPMGEPVYRRMGFETVCRLRTYVRASAT